MAEDTIEGRNMVLEALRSGERTLHKIFMVASRRKPGPLGEIKQLARKKGIQVEEVGKGHLNQCLLPATIKCALAAAKNM